MTAVRASAPGKLFLLGEYAVLDGAPALLTAVDRRVTVTVADSDDARWHLSTPGLHPSGFASGEIALGEHGEPPAGLDDSARERLRVFDAVRNTLMEHGALETAELGARALSVTIDSTELSAPAEGSGTAAASGAAAANDSANKLGLGSSAAVATALTAALLVTAGLSPSREDIRILATRAHRAAQGGTGSGGDVAASSHGGLIGYTRDSTPTALAWPSGLALTVVTTGTGSSTTELVSRVRDYARSDSAGYGDDIGRLASLARRAEAALRSPREFLDLAREYFDALLALDEHSRAGIVTEHHRELHSLAAGFGGVFKTSGAGGGDVGLVFSPAGAAADDLLAAFAQAGAQAVPLAFGADGVESTIVRHGAPQQIDNTNTGSGA